VPSKEHQVYFFLRFSDEARTLDFDWRLIIAPVLDKTRDAPDASVGEKWGQCKLWITFL
jgi:hypothetical protein